uniref:Uncharacterized protein n=1 Tax=Proboscia inermis TaxID=420281 RepID=A0A7S0GBM8_9STRA|mmetsp:Transcript_30029/g.30382  ORF Transcript_30029/g.30382 Transcript_30029/m.30382 type:complete len:197 (+) Transcript_30029:304-894(+)
MSSIRSTNAVNDSQRSTGPYIVEDRRMISRVSGDRIRITNTIEPGKRSASCFACVSAPSSFPCCGILPCCDYPRIIVKDLNASRYIYIRENSLEWNSPSMQRAKNSWCRLVVRDHVRTVYFDDEYFDEVYHDARCCSNLRTACCGGNGEQIQIDSRLYCNLCVRTYPCCCIPACFPKCCFPWMNRVSMMYDNVIKP